MLGVLVLIASLFMLSSLPNGSEKWRCCSKTLGKGFDVDLKGFEYLPYLKLVTHSKLDLRESDYAGNLLKSSNRKDMQFRRKS